MRHAIRLHFRPESKHKEYRLVIYRTDFETGKESRSRIWLDTTDFKTAQRRSSNILANANRLKHSDTRHQLDKMQSDYFLMKSPPHVSERSAVWYKQKIVPLFDYFKKCGFVCKEDLIDFDHVQFKTFLTGLYSNPSTANMVIRASKTFMNMYDFHNHAAKLTQLKEPRTRIRIISEEEYRLLLETASEQMKNLVSFFWKTGCRSGEVARIRWEDVDMDNETMRVKGKGRERIVSIAHMIDLLKSLPRGTSGYLFENQYGRACDPRSFAQLMWRCSDKAGISPRIRPQHFRQTTATRLLKGGASELVIRAQLGHVKIDTTEKHYLYIDNEMKKSAMKILK